MECVVNCTDLSLLGDDDDNDDNDDDTYSYTYSYYDQRGRHRLTASKWADRANGGALIKKYKIYGDGVFPNIGCPVAAGASITTASASSRGEGCPVAAGASITTASASSRGEGCPVAAGKSFLNMKPLGLKQVFCTYPTNL